VAAAPNAAARKRMIRALIEDDPDLHVAFLDAARQAEGESHLLRSSGRFPLCGRGDVNTYTVFAEAMRSAISLVGRVGVIVPSGIATDDTTKHFFAYLVERRSLVSLYDFRNKGFFPGAAGAQGNRFCLLTLTGLDRPSGVVDLFFRGTRVADLAEPERRFTLSASDFALLNPNTRTCPVFRTRRDAELTKAIYRRVPVLVDHGPPERNPWGVQLWTMFHMSNDSGLFRTRGQLEADGWTLSGNVFTRGGEHYLPLYEAKMLHQFHHRFGDYALAQLTGKEVRQLPEPGRTALADPSHEVLSRYWVSELEVTTRLAGRWNSNWLLGYRDICSSLDERTMIVSVSAKVGMSGSMPLIVSNARALLASGLFPCANAFVFDYVARQKVGGTHLKYFHLSLDPPAR
jgi:hypothetical protein